MQNESFIILCSGNHFYPGAFKWWRFSLTYLRENRYSIISRPTEWSFLYVPLHSSFYAITFFPYVPALHYASGSTDKWRTFARGFTVHRCFRPTGSVCKWGAAAVMRNHGYLPPPRARVSLNLHPVTASLGHASLLGGEPLWHSPTALSLCSYTNPPALPSFFLDPFLYHRVLSLWFNPICILIYIPI